MDPKEIHEIAVTELPEGTWRVSEEVWEEALSELDIYDDEQLNHDAMPMIDIDDDFVVTIGDIVVDHFRPFGTNHLVFGSIKTKFLDGRGQHGSCANLAVTGDIECAAMTTDYEGLFVVGGNLTATDIVLAGHHGSRLDVRGTLSVGFLVSDEGEWEGRNLAVKRFAGLSYPDNFTPTAKDDPSDLLEQIDPNDLFRSTSIAIEKKYA